MDALYRILFIFKALYLHGRIFIDVSSAFFLSYSQNAAAEYQFGSGKKTRPYYRALSDLALEGSCKFTKFPTAKPHFPFVLTFEP